MSIYDDVNIAVAERFNAIRHTFRYREGDYLYDGSRCSPGELGWRFRQTLSLFLHQPGGLQWEPPAALIGEIAAGQHDKIIEATWHDAASAEHWYRYEKDYGQPDEPDWDFPDDEEREDEDEESYRDGVDD